MPLGGSGAPEQNNLRPPRGLILYHLLPVIRLTPYVAKMYFSLLPFSTPVLPIRSVKIDFLFCARIFSDLYAHKKNTKQIVKQEF